jgi:hypothetical protein
LRILNRQHPIRLDALNHREVDKSKHCVASTLNDRLKKGDKKGQNGRYWGTYDIAFREEFAEGGEVDKKLVEDLLWDGRVGSLLFEFSGKVQDFMHNDEEVVAAPLRVTRDELSHNCIDLLDDVHAQQFFKFDLARSHDRSDNLECGGVELVVAYLEVLE